MSVAQSERDACWAVGVIRTVHGSHAYPTSHRDIERDTAWAERVYDEMGLAAGRFVHLVGAGAAYEMVWPYENALIRKRIPFGASEPVALDAARAALFLRRFALQALIGLSLPIVDYLVAQGRDAGALLGAVATVAALPEAYPRLRALGLSPWRMIPVGALFAFEPPAGGGARYDESEWLVESRDGELLLTAIGARACPLVRLRTGVRGQVERVDGASRLFLDGGNP